MKLLKIKAIFIFPILLVSLIVSYLTFMPLPNSTPLGSLTSNKLSTKYDKSFWLNEQKGNTKLWKQAKEICNFSSPNCGVIATIQNESFAQ